MQVMVKGTTTAVDIHCKSVPPYAGLSKPCGQVNAWRKDTTMYILWVDGGCIHACGYRILYILCIKLYILLCDCNDLQLIIIKVYK